MNEGTKQNIRGAILLIPLILIVALLAIIARPDDRYSEQGDQPTVATSAEPTDSITPPTLKPFDPNEADYRTLLDAGLERRIAVSILKWREAGKVFRIREDLALCYGMTDSMYFAIEPYIIIGEEYRIKPSPKYSDRPAYERDTSPRDTIAPSPFTLDTVGVEYLRRIGFTLRQAELVIRYRDMIGGYRSIEEFEECYAVDSAMADRLRPYIIFPEAAVPVSEFETKSIIFPIEINSADSATLIAVNGIGPKSIGQILRYRELLGGYYSVAQISELSVVTDDNFQRILPQIYCDSAKIKKICINFARPKELEVHPYLSNRMLRRIINHRELKGGWSTIEEMIEDNIFSEEEAARIAPYLDFGTNPE
uniref:helix-hairpin-helix domain-containing protein n=1 Tax=Alistipes sp. TaxID=1872444 RepID=UPI004056DB72